MALFVSTAFLLAASMVLLSFGVRLGDDQHAEPPRAEKAEPPATGKSFPPATGKNLVEKKPKKEHLKQKKKPGEAADDGSNTRDTDTTANPRHFSKADRYPFIFDSLKELLGGKDKLRILSFGCSRGEETSSLRDRFPRAQIDGVDDNQDVITANVENNSDKGVAYSTEIPANATYDAALIMSVMVKPKFKEFTDAMNYIDSHMKPGGYLTIYNSKYLFEKLPLFKKSYKLVAEGCPTGAEVELTQAADCGIAPHCPNGTVSPGKCGTTGKYCIERGTTTTYAENETELIKNYEKEGGKSMGCKFPNVFFQKK